MENVHIDLPDALGANGSGFSGVLKLLQQIIEKKTLCNLGVGADLYNTYNEYHASLESLGRKGVFERINYIKINPDKHLEIKQKFLSNFSLWPLELWNHG